MFRLHAHFRILDEMLERVGSPRRVEPSLAVIWAVFTWVVNRLAGRAWERVGFAPDELTLTLLVDLFATLLLVGWVVYGQQALNDYWDRQAGRSLSYRVSVWQGVLLALGGFLFGYDLLTSFGVLAASYLLASY